MDTRPRRADIDGLRALAVLSVLLFHYGVTGFSGGFVGVDIFIVVSGYWISRRIFEGLREGSWSYADFAARRARRLFPAFFVTLSVSYAAALWLLMPEDLLRFATTVLHSAVGTSNFFYWLKAGYFTGDAGRTPLLHTWSISLAVQLWLLWSVLLPVVLGPGASRRRVLLLDRTARSRSRSSPSGPARRCLRPTPAPLSICYPFGLRPLRSGRSWYGCRVCRKVCPGQRTDCSSPG